MWSASWPALSCGAAGAWGSCCRSGVSSWLYKDYSDIAVEQLNIILCWSLKNLIAQVSEQHGPPSGNPARAPSLRTIDLGPSLSIGTINTALSLSPLSFPLMYRLLFSFPLFLFFCLLHFPFVCLHRSAHHKSLSASPECLAYPLIKRPLPSLQVHPLRSLLSLPEQD